MKKVAVITGGASGIGRATGEAFLKTGFAVVLTDINAENLASASGGLSQTFGGDRVYCKASNVACMESVNDLADYVKNEVGCCGVLVNCAGVFRGGPAHLAPEEDFDIQFDINVRGIYHTVKAFVPQMLEAGSGAIVNIASVSGINGDYNAPLYCASKSAVIGLTKSMALDYAEKGIRVNCISPSATETPMFLTGTTDRVMNAFLNALPDHRLGKPDQIADAILFLASDAAKHIVGHNLAVDGGLSAWNGQPKQNKEE